MINAFILQHTPFKPQIVDNPEDIQFIVVDLFCGAGGTTIGFDQARNDKGNKIAIIAACVNHDHKAIRSHWENHPEVYHFEEDIRTLELTPLADIVAQYRKLYPHAKVVLWASLECTNFSKAKGGQARDADSRTLADHLDRYITAIDPDYVKIENVVEFMSWGPLNEKGKPVSMKSGQDWMRWRNHINSFGYRDEWKEMNSADFGSYTSRNRLFGCFAKDGLPIVWPEPTHSKKGSDKTTLFGNDLKKWKAVKDLLDFEDEGESIFTRKTPLVENSLKRIYAGMIKEVAGGKENFLIKYNSMNQQGKVASQSIVNPCPVIPCQGRLAVAKVAFLNQYNGDDNRVLSIENPCNTLPTENRFSLVQTSFITKYFSGRPMNKIASIDNPLATITTAGNQALVNVTPFITEYNGVSTPQSIDNPLATIPTKDRFSLIQIHWLDKQYSGAHNHQSIDQPAGTILTSDKHALMTAKGFIYNPSHGGHTMHIDQPCATIIARQDKAPLYFIQYQIDPNVRIEIYQDDSETMIKIKEFMALYGISDIKMRMLKVSELKVIQGFPEDNISAKYYKQNILPTKQVKI